jgi:hypothetical protein
MSYYYYNVRKGWFNMAAFLASQPSDRRGNPAALYNQLDTWCNSHTFTCGFAISIASIGIATLFSGNS